MQFGVIGFCFKKSSISVMYWKIVGDFFRIKSFISDVNLKRKRALLESNLSAIRLMQDDSQ